MTDARRYFNGLLAEDIAARVYRERGARVLATRWRSDAGEVDLVCQQAEALIFVEVKARRDHAAAANAISQRQWRRVAAAAQAYMSANGFDALTEMRFDAALVDQAGVVEIVENAALFE